MENLPRVIYLILIIIITMLCLNVLYFHAKFILENIKIK